MSPEFWMTLLNIYDIAANFLKVCMLLAILLVLRAIHRDIFSR